MFSIDLAHAAFNKGHDVTVSVEAGLRNGLQFP